MKGNLEKKKRKIFTVKRIVTGILILLILILLGVGFASYKIGESVANGLLYINEDKDTKEASIFQLKEWDYDIESFREKFKGEKVTLSGSDKNKIPTVHYMADESKDNDTIILIHGLGGDNVSVYPQTEMYLKNGWNVVAIDQRGSGDSTEEIVSFGYFEKNDMSVIVDYLKEYTDKKIILHGFSMGGATVGMYSGTDHANENVDGIILDSSIDSMLRMFLGVWEDMDTEDIPVDYVVWCGDMVMKMKYGFGFDDAEINLYLNKCEVPVLLIQSKRDELVPKETADGMFESIKSEKKIFWEVDSEHIEGYIDYPEEYTEVVFKFLNK